MILRSILRAYRIDENLLCNVTFLHWSQSNSKQKINLYGSYKNKLNHSLIITFQKMRILTNLCFWKDVFNEKNKMPLFYI